MELSAQQIGQITADIIRREGGDTVTDHPADRGGLTKFGITQGAWADYLRKHVIDEGRYALPERVADIDFEMAGDFYMIVHIAPFVWIEDYDLAALVIDCGVNHGVRRATQWLQRAAGATPDGVIGPKTRNAVGYGYMGDLYAEVLRLRLKFYADIIVRDPTQAIFARGWINRVCEFIR